eukprot:5671626-Lingulodinium_polyedra.AAC.1
MPRQRPPTPARASALACHGVMYATRLHCCTARGPHIRAAEMPAVWDRPYQDSAQSSSSITNKWQDVRLVWICSRAS